MKYKDENPAKTIETIEQYFSDIGFKLICKKSNDDVLYPSYVLVNPDTGIIVNGKGSNDLFAKASAYGEICERMFNWCYLRFTHLRPTSLGLVIPNCILLTPKLWQKEVDVFLRLESHGHPSSNLRRAFLDFIAENGLDVYCFEFHSASGERLCLPIELCDRFLGTNGMSAGNSYHEAFVQAFSEIVERKAIKDINAGIVIPKSIPASDIVNKESAVLEKLEYIKSTLPVDVYLLTFEDSYDYPIALVMLVDREAKKNPLQIWFPL